MDTLLLRRTFPELESSLLNYFRRYVPRDLYLRYNDTKHIVTWHNGSTTRFGYSASENDIYQYQDVYKRQTQDSALLRHSMWSTRPAILFAARAASSTAGT